MKTVNIYDFFPVKTDEQLKKFLEKDAQYEDRKEQFYSILLPTVTETQSKFGNAVLKAVFDHSFVVTHRWPTVK